MMGTTESYSVAVIGGGASGVIVAAHLLRRAGAEFRVAIIEPAHLGGGAAYSTDAPEHRLNVRVSRMSAYDDDPNHFLRWAAQHGIDDAYTFVARGLYRQYLQDTLTEAIAGREGVFRHYESTVEKIDQTGGRVEITLADGGKITAGRAVLALGNMVPRDPSIETPWYYSDPSYIRSPWASELDQIGLKDEVVILGTGLTAVDVFLTLEQREHRGRITAVSRHGRWPYSHASGADASFTLDLGTLPVDGVGLLRGIRDAITQAEMHGVPWQQVIDALRPVSNTLWQRASDENRRQFMRHLAPIWNTARHRIPSDAANALFAAAQRGQLRTVAGTLRRVDRLNSMLGATFDLREGGLFRAYPKWIINCTGPNGDVRTSSSPLVQQLLAEGTVIPNQLKLGFETDARGALVDDNGQVSPVLFTLGPTRRGTLIESTAVGEIRQQAAALSEILFAQTVK